MAVGFIRYRQIASVFFLAAFVLASMAFAQTAPTSANETVPTTAAPPPVGTTTVAPRVTPSQQHSRHKALPVLLTICFLSRPGLLSCRVGR